MTNEEIIKAQESIAKSSGWANWESMMLRAPLYEVHLALRELNRRKEQSLTVIKTITT